VIRDDVSNRDLLFLGTDVGAYVLAQSRRLVAAFHDRLPDGSGARSQDSSA